MPIGSETVSIVSGAPPALSTKIEKPRLSVAPSLSVTSMPRGKGPELEGVSSDEAGGKQVQAGR